MKKLRLLKSAALAMTLLLGAHIADACQGNACADVDWIWENNCHGVLNKGGRKVKFEWGAWSGVLNPGQKSFLTNPFGGGCPGYIIGDQKANYAD